MELVDLERDGFERPRRSQSLEKTNNCGQRMISLRKYSLAICLIEALTIALFIYLLITHHHQHQNHHHNQFKQCSQTQANSSMRTVAIDDHSNLLLGLIEGCNQRAHDLATSVRCESRHAQTCGSVETQVGGGSPAAELPEATLIVTSKAGQRLERSEIKLTKVDNCKCRDKTKLELWPTRWRQEILGWGGALTDSSINNILSLTTNGTRRLLDDYFGLDGLRFNMIRITIGGSDFSSRFYTNDDAPVGGGPDLNLTKFSLREEDLLYKIPMLRMIQQEYGEKKLFASMWSPPTWMKTNGHFNKGQLRGSIDDEPLENESERFYEALAELKVRFLEAYQREHIKVWGLTVMNEPQFSVQPFLDFNTMIFPPSDYANYVAKYLGPKVKQNRNLSHLKLMAHDDNRRFLSTFSWPILDQKRVRQFIDGVSVHGYADEAYHLMDETYQRYAQDKLFILPTELCSGHLPFMAKALIGNWHRGVHYALDIIKSLQNRASGWVDWNMALDTQGGPGWLGGRLDAAVIVDKARDVYHKSPMFHVMGHFSRYIPAGSQAIESRLVNAHYDHHLESVSFVLPTSDTSANQKMATVILNNNPYPIEVHLSIAPKNTSHYVISCPPDSISTLLYSINKEPN